MDAGLFLKALGVQALAIVVLFAILVALPLPKHFFEDYGYATGPAAWIVCSFVTGRVLALNARSVALAAVVGGFAGLLTFVLAGHSAGMVAALGVFAVVIGRLDM